MALHVPECRRGKYEMELEEGNTVNSKKYSNPEK